MEEPPPLDWINRIVATATSVWQAFVVPGVLGIWAVYQFRSKRTDSRGASEQVRETAFMDRLQARIATQDAENAALRRELADERTSGLRWMRLAQSWCQMAHEVKHEAANAMTPGGTKWVPPDLPGLEDLE